jgi:HEAT repeat protein
MFNRPLPRTLEASLRDMHEASERVRRSAIVDLARHARQQLTDSIREALQKALTDKDPVVRTEAAYALGDGRVVEALPGLLMAIDDDSPQVRQAAIDALGAIGDPRAATRLVRALHDTRADVRFQSIIALGKVSPDAAREAVLGVVDDDDPHVRYIAVRVAEELCAGGQSAPGESLELEGRVEQAALGWLQDIEETVRVAASILLARGGNLAGERYLLAALEGRIAGLAFEDEAAIMEIAGKLGLQSAVPVLERRAFGWVAKLRRDTRSWLSLVSLARMGHARARAEILGDLRGWSRQRRTMAVAAVGMARMTEAADILAAMRGDEAKADPQAVDEALGQLRASQS